MQAIELSIFSSRMEAVCEEMGAVLRRAAFSPNIKDRLDFSCAVFGPDGVLCAQAAHIPVHLGSMAWAMCDIVSAIDWQPGDVVFLNDPWLGGTHLPDVTAVSPLFVGEQLAGFVANRAHHADIGADAPGSMPLSRTLEEEGVVIAPVKLVRGGVTDTAMLATLTDQAANVQEARGDFNAQISANRTGLRRLQQLLDKLGHAAWLDGLAALNAYAERMARSALGDIPDGEYRFTDYMDDDGFGHTDIPIAVTLRVACGEVEVDFDGTAGQVNGNINCTLSIVAAAVYYVFRCLMPAHTPACGGALAPIRITAPEGCLLNARRPAAVAAGNVETSTRIVDVLLGALAGALPDKIPAASHGSMNNLAMGARGEQSWAYYETIGGGMGAGPAAAGPSGVQTHMTNTLNTPVEALEMAYPLRVWRYALRPDSGGAGLHRGGDGSIREYEFLGHASCSLLTERRLRQPWGLAGGAAGAAGINTLDGEPLAGKQQLQVRAGQRLCIQTPGGGGWGRQD